MFVQSVLHYLVGFYLILLKVVTVSIKYFLIFFGSVYFHSICHMLKIVVQKYQVVSLPKYGVSVVSEMLEW